MNSSIESNQSIFQDFESNRGYPKSQFVLILFRISSIMSAKSTSPAKRIAAAPYFVFYKLITEWLFGIEIPIRLSMGAGVRLRHGVGLVINPGCTIGQNVLLRQGVTIGNMKNDYDCPQIGDNVEIGAGAVLLGRVRIGHNSKIGAGALVVHNVPDNAVVFAPLGKIVVPDEE